MKIALKNLLLLTLFTLISFSSDSNPIDGQRVAVQCVRKEKNLAIIRIENKGLKSIFVPKDFWPQYFSGKDTLYLESVYKSKFKKKTLYFYPQFGDTVITEERIIGLVPNRSSDIESDILYNQFNAPLLMELKPNQHIVKEIRIILPYKMRDVIVRLYSSNFNSDPYSHDKFAKFEESNSFLCYSKIYEAVLDDEK